VPKSPELLDRLNEINADAMFARAFWTGEQVVMATELVADSIDREQIENACGVVGSLADHYDDELRTAFGGKTIFAEEPGSEAGRAGKPAEPKDDDTTAGYM
jgi:hypothetical protein